MNERKCEINSIGRCKLVCVCVCAETAKGGCNLFSSRDRLEASTWQNAPICRQLTHSKYRSQLRVSPLEGAKPHSHYLADDWMRVAPTGANAENGNRSRNSFAAHRHTRTHSRWDERITHRGALQIPWYMSIGKVKKKRFARIQIMKIMADVPTHSTNHKIEAKKKCGKKNRHKMMKIAMRTQAYNSFVRTN